MIELLNVLRGAGSKTMVTWGILLGLVLGFGTDFILVATGVKCLMHPEPEQLVGSPLFASLTDEQLRPVASLMES